MANSKEKDELGCLGVVDCLVGIIKALRLGSCLSSDGGSLAPSSPKKERRRKRKEEELSKIHGRMFLNGSSSVASLFTQQGKKGINQDAMVVWENFSSRPDAIFCGVFDGHGPYGHMVARSVRDLLPLKLSAHWEVNIRSRDLVRGNITGSTGDQPSEETVSVCSLDDESGDSVDLEEESQLDIFTTLKESFLKAFKVVDKELKLHHSINCFCSGTTAVTLIKQGQELVIGNVGDSRAVLGTRDQNDDLIAVQLTVDLKPNLAKEEERIKQCKGRVFALQYEPDVSRVWLPNYDFPGLAMSRAFGDFCLKEFGLISVPEISHRRLTERDEFIVLATDGVWDVLSNKEVVDIVALAPSRSCAARSVVESAVRMWKYEYPTSKIDDCAAVCLFLNSDSNDVATSSITNEKQERGSEILHEEGKGKGQTQMDDNSTSAIEGDEWSALEGVSRANTLLALPRFIGSK